MRPEKVFALSPLLFHTFFHALFARRRAKKNGKKNGALARLKKAGDAAEEGLGRLDQKIDRIRRDAVALRSPGQKKKRCINSC